MKKETSKHWRRIQLK